MRTWVTRGMVLLGLLMVLAPAPVRSPRQAANLPEYGVTETPASGIDWSAVGFGLVCALAIVGVLTLWYRQLRFREELEGGRPSVVDNSGEEEANDNRGDDG